MRPISDSRNLGHSPRFLLHSRNASGCFSTVSWSASSRLSACSCRQNKASDTESGGCQYNQCCQLLGIPAALPGGCWLACSATVVKSHQEGIASLLLSCSCQPKPQLAPVNQRAKDRLQAAVRSRGPYACLITALLQAKRSLT